MGLFPVPGAPFGASQFCHNADQFFKCLASQKNLLYLASAGKPPFNVEKNDLNIKKNMADIGLAIGTGCDYIFHDLEVKPE